MRILIVIIIIILIVLLLLIGTAVFIGFYISNRSSLINSTFSRNMSPEEAEFHRRTMEEADRMQEEADQEYTLVNKEGLHLRGWLLRAPEPSDVYVFLSHGYRSVRGGFEMGEYADLWRDRGYNLFVVDHRAHGKSEGRWISFGQHESEDCMEWINWMKQEFGPDIQIILQGHSMGCSTLLIMSGRADLPDNVKMIVADCGYTDFTHDVMELVSIPKFLTLPILKWSNVFMRLFLHIDLRKSDAKQAVRNCKVPILFIHGEKDAVVPVYMGKANYEACGSQDKELVIFPEAAHTRSYVDDPEKYREAVYRFADQYIEKR